MAFRRYVVRRERGHWLVWDSAQRGFVAAVYARRLKAKRAAVHLNQIARGERSLVRLEDGRYAMKTPTGLFVGRRRT